MGSNLLWALLISIVIQAGLYNITDDRDKWNNVWTIGLTLGAALFMLEKKNLQKPTSVSRLYPHPHQDKEHKAEKRPKSGQHKVIHLKDYRQAKQQEDSSPLAEPKPRRWVTILRTNDQTKIELLNGLLAHHNIPANIANKHSSNLLPAVDAMDMDLQVPEDLQERALKLLAQHGEDLETN